MNRTGIPASIPTKRLGAFYPMKKRILQFISAILMFFGWYGFAFDAESDPQLIGSDSKTFSQNRKTHRIAHYRHPFVIKGQVEKAEWVGHGTVYINGGQVSIKESRIDVTSSLKQGKNILCISASVARPQYQIIGRLTIKLADGVQQIVQTDGSDWRISLVPKKAPKDLSWLKLDYDDSRWQKATIIDPGKRKIWPLSGKKFSPRIPLWPGGRGPVSGTSTEPANAFLQIFHPSKPNGTAMVVCAGGGYGMNLWYGHEGVGMGKWLSQQGITAAVLIYRLPGGNHYGTLSDVKRAVRYMRYNSERLGVDPGKIGIIGFSAGGHLAAMASTKYDLGDPKAQDPIEKISSRPDFAILVYPVISLGEYTHVGTRKGWLGKDPSEKEVQAFSAHLQVTENTPPTFLTHALDDIMVPPINSELYFKALKDHGVEAQYKPLPAGGHGFRKLKGGMGGKNWDPWRSAALEWLKEKKFITDENDPK